MFRNPTCWGVFALQSLPSLPTSSTSASTVFFFSFLFAKQKEYTEQGICTRAQEGPWTFVKRFDCTAYAEHNLQVTYRAM